MHVVSPLPRSLTRNPARCERIKEYSDVPPTYTHVVAPASCVRSRIVTSPAPEVPGQTTSAKVPGTGHPPCKVPRACYHIPIQTGVMIPPMARRQRRQSWSTHLEIKEARENVKLYKPLALMKKIRTSKEILKGMVPSNTQSTKRTHSRNPGSELAICSPTLSLYGL